MATVGEAEMPGPFSSLKTWRAKASVSFRIASASVLAATLVRRMNTASGCASMKGWRRRGLAVLAGVDANVQSSGAATAARPKPPNCLKKRLLLMPVSPSGRRATEPADTHDTPDRTPFRDAFGL